MAPAIDDPAKGTALAGRAAAMAGVQIHYTANLEADLRDAAVFVYLTFTEGLGSAVLMAMAAGVPVVASNVGGLPEIVADGETGLLVENEPEAVAGALARLMNDQDLRRRMGERGRARVREEFSVERMVEGTLDVYAQALRC